MAKRYKVGDIVFYMPLPNEVGGVGEVLQHVPKDKYPLLVRFFEGGLCWFKHKELTPYSDKEFSLEKWE